MADWQSIREEWELGISERTLATKYSVPKTTLHDRAKTEKWIRMLPTGFRPTPPTTKAVVETPISTVNTARLLHEVIHRLAQSEIMDERMVKLLADALSQVHKIQMTAPTKQETSPYDLRTLLSYCTEEEREIVKPIFAAATARKQEEEEKIKPIRRTG
jgi:hypothetical protein